MKNRNCNRLPHCSSGGGRSNVLSSPIYSRSVLTPQCRVRLPRLFVQMVNLSPGLHDLLCSQQTALQPLYNLRSHHFLLAGISNLVLKDIKGTNSFTNLALATTIEDCQCICLITVWGFGWLVGWLGGGGRGVFFKTNPLIKRIPHPAHTVECFVLFKQVWKGENLVA